MNIFKYSNIKNYQNHEFFLAIFDVSSKSHQFSNDTFRTLISNSSGFFLKNAHHNNQLLNYSKFSRLIIDTVLNIGEIIENGGFLLVDKDLRPANNPVITLYPKDDLASIQQELEDLKIITQISPKTTQQKAAHKKNLEKQNCIIINQDNIEEYTNKIIQFLIVALNFDPFVRLPIKNTLNDSNFESIFINNLEMFSFFSPSPAFTDVPSNSINSKFLKPFFDKRHNISTKHNDPFQLIKIFLNEKQNNIHNDIVFDFSQFFSTLCQTIDSNTNSYNTNDRFNLFSPEISFEPDHPPYSIESDYDSYDPDYDYPSTYKSSHCVINLYSSSLLKMKEQFSTNSTIYQSDYPSTIPSQVSEFFLLKLFSNFKQDSDQFYQKDNTYAIQTNQLILLSLFRGHIQEKFPQYTPQLNDFFFNTLYSPNALLNGILYNDSYSPTIFSDESYVEKMKNKFLDIFLSEQKSEPISNLILKYDLSTELVECAQKILLEHQKLHTPIDNLLINDPEHPNVKYKPLTSHNVFSIPIVDLFSFSSPNNYLSVEKLLNQYQLDIKKSLQSLKENEFLLYINSEHLTLLSPLHMKEDLVKDLMLNISNYFISQSDANNIKKEDFFINIQQFYNETNLVASLSIKDPKIIKKQKI